MCSYCRCVTPKLVDDDHETQLVMSASGIIALQYMQDQNRWGGSVPGFLVRVKSVRADQSYRGNFGPADQNYR